jgi:hypothetical protein
MRLRLVIAALTFFAFFYALTSAVMSLLPASAPEWQTNAGVMTGFIVSLFIVNKLVNVRGTKFWRLSRAPEPADPSVEDGLLVSTSYRAVRYFEVEESREEGPHYFIELRNGAVLYLNGRYLDAFAHRKFLNLFDSPRKFPCSDFVVKRDRYEGGVADIECRGRALEPEFTAPPFEGPDWEGIMALRDGDIITSRTYEEMKARKSDERPEDASEEV